MTVFRVSLAGKSQGVGHSITWQNPLPVKQVEIPGATAFAVPGLLFFYLIVQRMIYLNII